MPRLPLRKNRLLTALKTLGLSVILYVALSYITLPFLWRNYETHVAHPRVGLRSTTTAGIPGDPINLILTGSAQDLERSMTAAGWFRADPITLGSSLRLAHSILFGDPYDTAPVSTLLFEGRPEDVAYEKPIGNDADRRHHVRFWRFTGDDPAAALQWYGAASEDIAVGLNHLTGQVTHHIAPDIDAERDGLLADLRAVNHIDPVTLKPGIGAVKLGRNGENDRFFTDGLLATATLQPITD